MSSAKRAAAAFGVLKGDESLTISTAAEALTFCQQFYGDAEVMADGRISAPPLPDPPT